MAGRPHNNYNSNNNINSIIKQGQIQALVDQPASPPVDRQKAGADHGCEKQSASDMGASYRLNP